MARAMKDSGIEWIGEIPEGWSISRLKYIGSYINGFAFKPEQWGNTGKRIIRIQDLTGSSDKPNYYDGEIDSKYYVKNGDILVSWAATLAAFIWDKGDGLLNQHIFKAINNETIVEYDFFFWLIKVAMEYMNNDNKHGIMMQHVTLDVFGNFTVALPPISEQKKISSFLKTECARIDAVIEQTRASIEEYKKLKQSVITQAVTKGIRPSRRMVNSGVDWIGQIPDEWAVFRIANLYDERNERGTEDLPILTVSINTGISDHEIPDEEKDRVVVRSEDRTLYKRVRPGDLAYNMMRAWQGAFGAARVDGMVSPAYVVAKPKMPGILDSRYVEALLRTPSAIEEMHRYSRGITDFRLRLYWPEFKNIRVCVPSIKEQVEIADYIDEKAAEIDALIQKKQQFLDEMEAYKKSLIFEYVTGKKEVR